MNESETLDQKAAHSSPTHLLSSRGGRAAPSYPSIDSLGSLSKSSSVGDVGRNAKVPSAFSTAIKLLMVTRTGMSPIRVLPKCRCSGMRTSSGSCCDANRAARPSGLAHLRNDRGDAHGRGPRTPKPARRHAEFAFSMAIAMTLFLLATAEPQRIP